GADGLLLLARVLQSRRRLVALLKDACVLLHRLKNLLNLRLLRIQFVELGLLPLDLLLVRVLLLGRLLKRRPKGLRLLPLGRLLRRSLVRIFGELGEMRAP